MKNELSFKPKLGTTSDSQYDQVAAYYKFRPPYDPRFVHEVLQSHYTKKYINW